MEFILLENIRTRSNGQVVADWDGEVWGLCGLTQPNAEQLNADGAFYYDELYGQIRVDG